MRKLTIIFFIVYAISALAAQTSTFAYIEGEVNIKRMSGELAEARMGDRLNAGDSVITGLDGYAELTLENNSSISIDSDTVFRFAQKEKKGEKKSIFMVVLGKIGFKFDRLLNEPDIQTPSTVAGVRGTEFTVLSALDGSALYIVDEGSVAVESEGSLVVLETQEGVEVPMGGAPGDKFEVLKGSLDFSGWLNEGRKNFSDNPLEVLADVREKLDGLVSDANESYADYQKARTELYEMRQHMTDLEKEKGIEAKGEYYKAEVFPKEILTGNLVLNYRYFALSALSLRRFVVGSMYVDMKTAYIMDSANPRFTAFLGEYEAFLKNYEKNVVPLLVEADI